MSEEESVPPEVEFWLSPETKHDCYFNVGSVSGSTERIGAFKAFLIGYSEPLRAMLQDSELAEQGDISIIDIEPDTFRDFLKCLYMGLTDTFFKNISFQKCCDLLYVSDKYLVTQLKEKLIKQCLNSLSSEISCINVACSSKVFMQEKCLKEALSKIVQCQIKSIISSEQFLQITDDSLLWILELDPLDIDEKSLWQSVMEWAEKKADSSDSDAIRKCTLQLLKYVRFCSMNVQDFCETVIPTNVLTGKEVRQICKYYGTNEMPTMAFICNTVAPRNHTDNFKPPDIAIFSYHVYDMSSLSVFESRFSKRFQFHNLDWTVSVERRLNNFGVYLDCMGSKSNPSWECYVNATLILVNHKGPNYSLSLNYHKYYSTEPYWGYPSFLSWHDVMDPSKNYVLNDSILILVTMST